MTPSSLPPAGDKPAVAAFAFHDEHGLLLYSTEKPAPEADVAVVVAVCSSDFSR